MYMNPFTFSGSSNTHWLSRLIVRGVRAVFDRADLASERARLREMSDAQLDDLGLNRSAARREAMRPFWQGTRCP